VTLDRSRKITELRHTWPVLNCVGSKIPVRWQRISAGACYPFAISGSKIGNTWLIYLISDSDSIELISMELRLYSVMAVLKNKTMQNSHIIYIYIYTYQEVHIYNNIMKDIKK